MNTGPAEISHASNTLVAFMLSAPAILPWIGMSVTGSNPAYTLSRHTPDPGGRSLIFPAPRAIQICKAPVVGRYEDRSSRRGTKCL